MTANAQIADDVLDRTVALYRFDAAQRRSILRLLKKLETDLVTQLASSDLTTFGRRRLSALLKLTEALIETQYGQITDEMLDALKGVAGVEGRKAVAAINNSVQVDLATVYLAPATLSAIASESLIEGAPSALWWGRQSRAMQRRFSDTVRLGLSQGQTTAQIVKRVREEVFPWNRRNATSIVRTSVQTVANAARMRTYEVNSSVVKGVAALVTFDDRTTRLCMSRSGFAWDLDGAPLKGTKTDIPFPGPPPWHWGCRTTLTAVLKSWEELGATKKVTVPPGTRSSMDGQVADTLDYEAWLKTKSAAFQRERLGPGRYKLWKEGKLQLRDLVDQSGNEYTLEELSNS